jgi:nucleotide-binding universal stress UspA family protein
VIAAINGVLLVKHILVAIDGSAGSTRAALYARDLARQTGSDLTILVAIQPASAVSIPPFDAIALTNSHPDPQHLAAAQALVNEIEADMSFARVQSRVGIGPAAEAICAEAAACGADLIIVGARGLSTAERLLLGSVSQRVLRDADRPVLVVR